MQPQDGVVLREMPTECRPRHSRNFRTRPGTRAGSRRSGRWSVRVDLLQENGSCLPEGPGVLSDRRDTVGDAFCSSDLCGNLRDRGAWGLAYLKIYPLSRDICERCITYGQRLYKAPIRTRLSRSVTPRHALSRSVRTGGKVVGSATANTPRRKLALSSKTTPVTVTFPRKTGAAAMPVASRLESMAATPFLTEWPEKDASGAGHQPGAAEHHLRRLDGLVRNCDEHVPTRSFVGYRQERQPVALLTPDRDAGGFPLGRDGVGSIPGDDGPGFVAHYRHRQCLCS